MKHEWNMQITWNAHKSQNLFAIHVRSIRLGLCDRAFKCAVTVLSECRELRWNMETVFKQLLLLLPSSQESISWAQAVETCTMEGGQQQIAEINMENTTPKRMAQHNVSVHGHLELLLLCNLSRLFRKQKIN